MDVRVIILFTPLDNVPYIMESAYTAGLLETGYAWIVIDIHAQMVSQISQPIKIETEVFPPKVLSLNFLHQGVMYEGAVPPGFPPYIKGLLILRPLISDGNLLKTFDLGWKIRDIPQSVRSGIKNVVRLFAQKSVASEICPFAHF